MTTKHTSRALALIWILVAAGAFLFSCLGRLDQAARQKTVDTILERSLDVEVCTHHPGPPAITLCETVGMVEP